MTQCAIFRPFHGPNSGWGWLPRALWEVLCAIAAIACTDLKLDPPVDVIHARFDSDAKVIPMPSDVLRDSQTGRLDLPVDDEEHH